MCSIEELTCFSEYDQYFVKAKKTAKKGRGSGGILVLIKKAFKSFVEIIPTTVENVLVFQIQKALFNTELDVFWFCTYVPPANSTFWNQCNSGFGVELLENCIMEMNNWYNFHILIVGDLNSRTANDNCVLVSADLDFSYDETHFQRFSDDKKSNTFGYQLLELCDVFDIVILNGLQKYNFDGSSTYICEEGSSTVDYFLASVEIVDNILLNSLTVLDHTESDHFPVVLSLSLPQQMHTVKEDFRDKTITDSTKCVWDQSKECIFKDTLKSDNLQYVLQGAYELIEHDVDKALELFNACFNVASECMKRKHSNKKTRSNGNWFNAECKKAKVLCRKYLIMFRDNRNDKTRGDYITARKDYYNTKKNRRQQFSKEKAEKLANDLKNSKDFWKTASDIGCGKKRNNVSERIEMSKWVEHFETVLRNEEHNFMYNLNYENENVSDTDDSMLNIDIPAEDVAWSVKDLKLNKSCGNDGTIAEMLKCGSNIAIPFLTKLFNVIFDKGIFPSQWSKAIMVPIHKKGSLHDVDNYRGISLLNVVSKCYTKVLNKRLRTWLDTNNVISECQAGFRKNYSTVDQIFNLNALIQKTLSRKGRKLYVAFVDFKKAFDSVKHNKLFECLLQTGVKGRFFETLRAMYSSLTSCIRVNGAYSEFFDCPTGVRQGCVLSPALFSMFINQLASHMNDNGRHGIQMLPGLIELFILLFADDVALLATTPIGLQNQLRVLENCCEELKLQVNIEKTKIMVFRKGGILGKHDVWYYDNEKIDVVNKYCYLGYIFTPTASAKLGTRHLATKGKKALFALNNAFKSIRDMSQDSYFKIFDVKIKPILTYSSEIWGLNRLDHLEKIHLLACKTFLGVPLQTPNKMVYGDLGRYPLFINTYVTTIKYWFKILKMARDRLPLQVYNMLLAVDRQGKQCWVSLVKNVLCQTGFMYVWLFQGAGDELSFLRLFKNRLIDMFVQEWTETMRGSERHQQYFQMKGTFERETYLCDIDRFYFRSCVSKARCSMLPLNGNLNRFSDNFYCKLCPFCKTKIEDERHFIIECPRYDNLRRKFLQHRRYLPLHAILGTRNKYCVRQLSNFIVFALKTRNEHVENV
jgi:hypothetical protein